MINSLKKILCENRIINRIIGRFNRFVDNSFDKLIFKGKTINKILNWLYKHFNLKIVILIPVCILVMHICSFQTKNNVIFIIMHCTEILLCLFYINFISFGMDKMEHESKTRSEIHDEQP
jgi:uncharacterized membrane protein